MQVKCIIVCFIVFAYCNSGFSQDTAKYYYPSGQLRLLHVKVDSTVIYEKIFYENGRLMVEGYMKFVDGSYRLLNVKAYYDDGAVKSVFCDTSYTLYERNGSAYLHKQMKDGIENGDGFIYQNGLLFIQNHYRNGQKDGRQISYYMRSGKLAAEENYSNGRLDGLSKNYDTLGNISMTLLYKNGAVLRATYFDPTEKIIRTSDGQAEDKKRQQTENFSKDALHR
jgi:antitoxin component YwqK of YwqJK toxin-antitoxin module